MSILKEKIYTDFISVFKEKKVLKKNILNLLKADIQRFEKENGITTDDKVIEFINSMLKKVREVIVVLKDYPDRKDSLDIANTELEILMSYLPKQLSIKEIENKIDEAIRLLGNDFNAIMKKLPKELKGLVDNKVLTDIVRKKTSNK